MSKAGNWGKTLLNFVEFQFFPSFTKISFKNNFFQSVIKPFFLKAEKAVKMLKIHEGHHKINDEG